MLIVLNKHSNDGNGARKWSRIRNQVEMSAQKQGQNFVVIDTGCDCKQQISRAFQKGERVFISAGGDGTLHFVLNILMALPDNQRRECILGAVGLGSSNDFHKPFNNSRIFNGISLRIDSENLSNHNVGVVEYTSLQGETKTEYFILNGGIGMVADGNRLYNIGNPIINFLKPRWALAASNYAAIHTVLTHRNFPVSLKIDQNELLVNVSNLAIVIVPWFSGTCRYDLPVGPEADYFCVTLLENMGIFRKFLTFYYLSNGRFKGLPQTRFWMTDQVVIEPQHPLPFEMDGEVVMITKVETSLDKGALRVCQ